MWATPLLWGPDPPIEQGNWSFFCVMYCRANPLSWSRLHRGSPPLSPLDSLRRLLFVLHPFIYFHCSPLYTHTPHQRAELQPIKPGPALTDCKTELDCFMPEVSSSCEHKTPTALSSVKQWQKDTHTQRFRCVVSFTAQDTSCQPPLTYCSGLRNMRGFVSKECHSLTNILCWELEK